jgi:hypothetical protein
VPLKNEEAVEIAQLIIRLCGGEDFDAREEAREWVGEFIAYAGAVVDGLNADRTPKSAWDVLSECLRVEQSLPRYGPAAGRSAIIQKGTEWWLPAGALKESSGSRLSWGDFTASLREIGWRREERDVREPSSRAERPDAGRVHRRFYVGED